MTLSRMGLIAALAALACGAAAWATPAVLVNDTFDTYANQAALDAVWAPAGTTAPTAVELSSAKSVSGSQSVRMPGTGTSYQSRSKLTFAETGNVSTDQSVVWSFDFYDSTGSGNPQRNYCNLHDGAANATNMLVSMGLNNNQLGSSSGGSYYMARILGYTVPTVDPDGGPNEGYTGAGIYFKLNDFGVGTRSIGWHNLKVVISTDNGLSTDYEFYVDNKLAEKVSNVGAASSIRSYDAIYIGSAYSNSNTEAFVDNMKLEVTPEPASLILLAIGGLFVSRRRVA